MNNNFLLTKSIIIKQKNKNKIFITIKEKRRPKDTGDAKGKDDISREALGC